MEISGGEWETVGAAGVGLVDTLLGPEETGPGPSPCGWASFLEGGCLLGGGWFLSSLVVPGLCLGVPCFGGCGGGCWLLFENCTVDASIS